MLDQYEREINYMRVSITDRCNLRCRYCMPEEGIAKVPMESILTYEEILRICRAAAQLGICDIRITGGEPLVRLGCPDLIRQIKDLPGIRRVMLTTNGQLLGEYATALKDVGLDGVNVSLDSLQEERYTRITRGGALQRVMNGIASACDAGLVVKINTVLQRGLNEDEAEDFAELAFEKGIPVRFIEMMPIGFGASEEGVSNAEVLARLQSRWPLLQQDYEIYGSGPAVYFHLPGRRGSVGFISAMHHQFCQDCNRIRLTSQGLLKPCLCFNDAVDLKVALMQESEEQLKEEIAKAICAKPVGHGFQQGNCTEDRTMSQIGG